MSINTLQSAQSINDHDTPENKIKFNKSQAFEIKTKESDFKLKVSYNETMFLFEVEKKAEFHKNEYANLMSFDDLTKNYRFFLQFESTEEVVNSLSIMVKNNNLKILEGDAKMKIEITNPTNQRTFGIDVPIKEKNLRMEVNGLVEYMSSLNNRVTTLENKNKELEKQVKELMSIKEEYEKLKKQEIQKENRYFKDSSIVKLEDENTIISWFEKKPTKFNKLLDSKIDGDSTNAFENKCAKKCPTMVFVKTTNGYRFGGFTTILWTKGGYGKDNKAFLFSLDRKEKYNITNENYANRFDSGSFNFGALCIYTNCTSHRSNFVSNGGFETVPQNFAINGGENNFTVSSYEVYQVEY
jgi:hypothetical protein